MPADCCGMATKKYTVTLAEEFAEKIRGEWGDFTAYATRAIERQREQDRLGELVAWMEEGHGPLTEAELAEAEAERRDHERYVAERDKGSGRGKGSGAGGGSNLSMAG